MRTRCLAILALTLAGAAPTTRPSANRYRLRESRYAGATAATAAEVTVDPGVPFSTRAQVDGTTLTLDGTVAVRGHRCDLRLRCDEATADPATGGTGHQTINIRVESDPGHKTWPACPPARTGSGGPRGSRPCRHRSGTVWIADRVR